MGSRFNDAFAGAMFAVARKHGMPVAGDAPLSKEAGWGILSKLLATIPRAGRKAAQSLAGIKTTGHIAFDRKGNLLTSGLKMRNEVPLTLSLKNIPRNPIEFAKLNPGTTAGVVTGLTGGTMIGNRIRGGAGEAVKPPTAPEPEKFDWSKVAVPGAAVVAAGALALLAMQAGKYSTEIEKT